MEFRGLEQKLVFVNEESDTKTIIEVSSQVKITIPNTGEVVKGIVTKIETRTAKFFVQLEEETTYMAYVDPNEIEEIEVIK